jgi:hypothetical protein
MTQDKDKYEAYLERKRLKRFQNSFLETDEERQIRLEKKRFRNQKNYERLKRNPEKYNDALLKDRERNRRKKLKSIRKPQEISMLEDEIFLNPAEMELIEKLSSPKERNTIGN